MAGGLFVLPGVVAIMVLSCIYARCGNVPIVVGAVLRSEGGRVGHCHRGGGAHRQASAQEPAVDRAGRRRLHRRFSFSVCRFPIIVFGAGMIGFVGGSDRRCSVPRRRRARTEARAGSRGEPARRAVARPRTSHGAALPASVASVWLALWLGPGGSAARHARREPMCSARSLCSSARWRWSPSAAPTPFWPTSRSRRSSTTTGSSPARCSMVSAWPRRRRAR